MTTELLYREFLASAGICTDTRQLKPGQLFFALKGPNFDGNKYVVQALEMGAGGAVSDDATLTGMPGVFIVPDALKALQDLATHKRTLMNIPVIGIAGSNGKTTTKELIAAVLRPKFITFSTPGNLNNHIGVPLTLLAMPEDTQIAVIEMGANHLGELEHLCSIAMPTHGLVTNVGLDHLEGYGSPENVEEGNFELYKYLTLTGGTVFINSEDSDLSKMIPVLKHVFTYPGIDDFYTCEILDINPYLKIKTENCDTVSTALIGKYNFYNVAAALCIASYFKVKYTDAQAAVAAYRPTNNRSQVIEKNGITIIADAYNANPSSMEAAIRSFADTTLPGKILILGQMNELGMYSGAQHIRMALLASELGFKDIWLCGKEFAPGAESVPEAKYFTSFEELKNYLITLSLSKKSILIKGSRSMALEKLIDFIN